MAPLGFHHEPEAAPNLGAHEPPDGRRAEPAACREGGERAGREADHRVAEPPPRAEHEAPEQPRDLAGDRGHEDLDRLNRDDDARGAEAPGGQTGPAAPPVPSRAGGALGGLGGGRAGARGRSQPARARTPPRGHPRPTIGAAPWRRSRDPSGPVRPIPRGAPAVAVVERSRAPGLRRCDGDVDMPRGWPGTRAAVPVWSWAYFSLIAAFTLLATSGEIVRSL